MLHQLAKQLINDDGDVVEDPKWHWVHDVSGDEAILCTGEFINDACGSGNGSSYEIKVVQRGGITCERCLQIIKEFKAIKL